MMYEYTYEHISIDRFQNDRIHKEIINEKAKNGFRYVGAIPTRISKSNVVLELDLVFEKELKETEIL